MTSTNRPSADGSQRKLALTAGLGLLFMALLAPFAEFGVLTTLVVPADATATVNNLLTSDGLFRAAIAALLIVILLDVLVAWALYVLLRPENPDVALLTAWLRLAFTAVFAYALVNLLDVAQLLGNAGYVATLAPEQLHAQVMSSTASFRNGWDVALAIFGLHLAGLGVLLFRSSLFPRVIGVLVMVAAGGYLVDTFGAILVPDYAVKVSVVTFVGEALLIPWRIWMAIKGARSGSESPRGEVMERRRAQPTPAAS